MRKKFFFSHDLFRELDDVDKIKKMFQRNETMVIHPMKFRKNITTSPFAICVILLHNEPSLPPFSSFVPLWHLSNRANYIIKPPTPGSDEHVTSPCNI